MPLARKSDVAATYLLKTDTVPLARKSDVIGKNNVKFFTGSTNASGEITINFTAFPLRINGASIVGYNSSTADTEQPFCALRTNIITNNVSSVTFRCLKGTTAGLTQPTVVPSASTSVMITLFGE